MSKFDQVEVGRVRRQEDRLDAEGLQVVPNGLGALVAGVVADDLDPSGDQRPLLQLPEQGAGGLGIEAVVEAHRRLHAFQVDGAVAVYAPTTAVGAHRMALAALDPTARDHRSAADARHRRSRSGLRRPWFS